MTRARITSLISGMFASDISKVLEDFNASEQIRILDAFIKINDICKKTKDQDIYWTEIIEVYNEMVFSFKNRWKKAHSCGIPDYFSKFYLAGNDGKLNKYCKTNDIDFRFDHNNMDNIEGDYRLVDEEMDALFVFYGNVLTKIRYNIYLNANFDKELKENKSADTSSKTQTKTQTQRNLINSEQEKKNPENEIEISKEAIGEIIASSVKTELENIELKSSVDDQLIYGIRGLAAFLKCSLNKAQGFKHQHPEIVYSFGKNLMFKKDEVLAAMKKKKK